LKLEALKNPRARLASFALAAIACVTACGSNSSRGAGDGFVGTWSCPQLPAGAQTLVIAEYADNSLSVASGDSDAGSGSSFCDTDQWVYSGATASMKAGTSCLGGAGGTQVITVQSFLLALSGSALVVSASETVVSADKTSKKVTLLGSCKKQ
jgi:hypothetical protein